MKFMSFILSSYYLEPSDSSLFNPKSNFFDNFSGFFMYVYDIFLMPPHSSFSLCYCIDLFLVCGDGMINISMINQHINCFINFSAFSTFDFFFFSDCSNVILCIPRRWVKQMHHLQQKATHKLRARPTK